MAHSYVCSYYHVIFSTKERRPTIHDDIREHLWPYVGGIARDNKMKALAVGGVADHCHALLSLPSTIAISKAVQLIKGNSSKWVHEEFPKHRTFAWQEGYGAFSIGVSQIPVTIRYIHNQEEHHRKRSFEETSEGNCLSSLPGLHTLHDPHPSDESLGYFPSPLPGLSERAIGADQGTLR